MSARRTLARRRRSAWGPAAPGWVRALPGLLAVAATALLASGCCDQQCDCPGLDAPDAGPLIGDAEAGPGRPVGGATANNSPRVDSLAVSLKGCAGTVLGQTLSLSDPDGDEVTLAHRVVHAPPGATVQVKPDAPIKVPSGGAVPIEVFCDRAGDVRVEYTVTDAFGLAGSGPYAVVYHFHDCPPSADAGHADSSPIAGDATAGDATGDAGP